ncbi:MAG: uracil-DNA glycosylase [Pseudomonadales bacterium]|nr:uracil-DNA glycosylase [Pseudomonadales bacterium]
MIRVAKSVERQALSGCTKCSRLAQHACELRQLYPSYHARPVPSWGVKDARILLVGLAPGLHGAFKTGRPFVGDASGNFLFSALHELDLASSPDPSQARLNNLRITNAVKCLPPSNAPKSEEVNNCQGFLAEELIDHAPKRRLLPRAIVSLGGVAHRAVTKLLFQKSLLGGYAQPDSKPCVFKHGARQLIDPKLLHVASFHPSQLNVNTRRITQTMLCDALTTAKEFVSAD